MPKWTGLYGGLTRVEGHQQTYLIPDRSGAFSVLNPKGSYARGWTRLSQEEARPEVRARYKKLGTIG